jgi:hypothetical protein
MTIHSYFAMTKSISFYFFLRSTQARAYEKQKNTSSEHF